MTQSHEALGHDHLLQERDKWRLEFEQGTPLDCHWLDEYREHRNDKMWRSTRALERLCEYVLYLESKLGIEETP